MLLSCASKFQIIAGLKYSFIGNLHVRVFLTYKTRIMTTSNDFTTSRAGTGSLPSFFISTHFFFPRILVIRPKLNSNFSTQFYFLSNILRFPSIS